MSLISFRAPHPRKGLKAIIVGTVTTWVCQDAVTDRSSMGEMMRETEKVQLRVDEGVAIVTLDAPERRNALTPPMAERLVAICDEIDGDTEVGAAVIQGAGGHFCAGAHRDVLGGASEDPAHPDHYEAIGSIYRAFHRVGELSVPSIAAGRGAAVGAGINLLMATDLRIVGASMRILSGFLPIGIHAGGGHLTLLHRTAGRETTSAMAIFGEELDGERAVAMGLAWECVPDEEVEQRAVELAKGPAQDPELARATVATFRAEVDSVAMPLLLASQAERAAQMWSLRRRDLR